MDMEYTSIMFSYNNIQFTTLHLTHPTIKTHPATVLLLIVLKQTIPKLVPIRQPLQKIQQIVLVNLKISPVIPPKQQ